MRYLGPMIAIALLVGSFGYRTYINMTDHDQMVTQNIEKK